MIYNKPNPETEKGEHRLGRFIIDKQFLLGHKKDLTDLFGKMVVLRVHERVDCWGIEYVAISEMFDPVPFGNVIPLYQIVSTKNTDGSVNFRIQKEEHISNHQVTRLVDLG